jgi:diguanylate cyclase (GGDEF)-like protein
MRILIAEDDPTFQRILGSLIAKWGHEPVIACNGSEAWEYLQAPDGPRLALLDWVMPGLNGIEVCRHLRSRINLGYTYVIILTAKAGTEDAIVALEAGCDDIVSKPFHPHELRARINTAQRILALEENLSTHAFYDQLTGLANRTLLEERFRKSAEASARTGGTLAIFYIDLDRFKAVNDTFGHATGDALLTEVTLRLKRIVADSDTLARVGGDEFVYLASVENASGAGALASKVRETIEATVDTIVPGFAIGASIGISLFPRDGRTLDVLVHTADSAMYEIKRRRRADDLQFLSKGRNGNISPKTTATALAIRPNSIPEGVATPQELSQ